MLRLNLSEILRTLKDSKILWIYTGECEVYIAGMGILAAHLISTLGGVIEQSKLHLVV